MQYGVINPNAGFLVGLKAFTAAVREPDGSLIYLVDQQQGGQHLYDTDFNMHSGVVAKGGLKRIDHMAMALPADSSCKCFTGDIRNKPKK